MNPEFMQRAIALAVASVAEGGGPFGAVIVRDGEVVGEASNRVTREHDPTAHAEVLAIRAACARLGTFQLDGCDLYTSCEPCPMCLGAIYWARLARVFYGARHADAADAGFDDSFIYREIALPPAERRIPMAEVAREAAQAPFAAWQACATRTDY